MSSERELKVLQGLRARLGATREISESDEAILADLAHRLVSPRPPFLRAVAKDAMVYAYHRSEMDKIGSKVGRWLYILRLPFRASEFFALVLYRLRVLLRAWHIPVMPTLLNWMCVIGWGIRIADPAILDEGIYIPHGLVEIEGLTYIGRRCYLAPDVGIGLVQGDLRGPRFENSVFVGTGAKILGPVTIGSSTTIGANAVVLTDVPARSTAVGVPARVLPNPKAGADAANVTEDAT